LRNDQQIKKDLEEVDDVFAANVWSCGLVGGEENGGKKDVDPDHPPPEEEWLNTSSDEESKIDNSLPGYDCT